MHQKTMSVVGEPVYPLNPPSLKCRLGRSTKEWSEYWIEFSPQTSRGSFSAVSTPIFASKYALELGSIWKEDWEKGDDWKKKIWLKERS